MRGEIVTIAVQGDFGKPRPALVVQANQFSELGSLTVLLITSAVVAAPLIRVTIEPNADNGLQKPSQVIIDKAMTVHRDKVGTVIGHIDPDAMLEVERCLAVFLGIAK